MAEDVLLGVARGWCAPLEPEEDLPDCSMLTVCTCDRCQIIVDMMEEAGRG